MLTPTDLAHRLGVTPLQVRRVLRELYGTLKRQDRGPRWYLTPAEVSRVTAMLARRDPEEVNAPQHRALGRAMIKGKRDRLSRRRLVATD